MSALSHSSLDELQRTEQAIEDGNPRHGPPVAVSSIDREDGFMDLRPFSQTRRAVQHLKTVSGVVTWSFVPSYFSHGNPFEAPSHSEPCTPL